MTDFETVLQQHWEDNWKDAVPKGDVSLLNIFNRDFDNLLRREVAPWRGMAVSEIGFAPGKMLRHLEKNYGAHVTGYDFSAVGCRAARAYAAQENSQMTIVETDVELDPPPPASADLCYSLGVVEHFADPTAMVKAHIDCLKPGGKALIVLPAFRGFAARFQQRIDPENLAIHNLETMEPGYWQRYDRLRPDVSVRAYTTGRPNPFMFSLPRFGLPGRMLQLAVNFGALATPQALSPLHSMVVIVFTKDGEARRSSADGRPHYP